MEGDEEYNFRVPGENPESAGWVERLREAVEKAGGNRAAARLADVPLGSLNNWLTGRMPRLDTGLKLAKALGVSAEWLTAGGTSAPMPDFVAHAGEGTSLVLEAKREGDDVSEYAILPRYDVQASAGEGVVVSNEQVVAFLAFRRDWLRTTLRRPPEALTLIEARGNSMAPTIHDGDLLIVDTAERAIANGAVHVLQLADQLLVKRLERRLDGTVVVHSDNPRYAPETLPGATADALTIVGHVVWQGGPVRS